MIDIRHITKKYGDIKILDNLSFQLKDAETAVILGPSGSGKSTLLRLVAGLEMPDSGEIFIAGSLCTGSALQVPVPPHKRNLGFVFQSAALWPHMTVEQNILFGIEGMPKKQSVARLEELLEKTAISHLKGRYPDEISGGEARRVSIARSLAPHPRCLLMDEPLTNIDAELKDELLKFILDSVKAEGTSLLYVTHDQSEANRISQKQITFSEKRWQ